MRSALITPLAALLLLSGCSESGSRSAAAESASNPAASVSVSAPVKALAGSRLCILNDSSLPAALNFQVAQSSDGNKTLNRGDRACAEGAMPMGSNDVEAVVNLPLRRSYRVDAVKPFLPGKAYARVSQLYNYYCTSDAGMEGGEVRVWDDGVLRFTIVAGGLSGRWNFDVTIADSQEPTADGKQRRC